MIVDYKEVWAPGHDGVDHHIGTVTIPIKTVSEANARDHWATRAKRTRTIRTTCALACGAPLAKYREGLAKGHVQRLHVRIVRVAPRELDGDNLQSATKGARDGIADALDLQSDRDPRVTWHYHQRKSSKGMYAVEVTAWSEVPR